MDNQIARASNIVVDHALSVMSRRAGLEKTAKIGRDFATTDDFAIEDYARKKLAELTPSLGFFGEERGHSGDERKYWCLDPIDGTTNYSKSIPMHGVSLALIQGEQPIHGQIALPQFGERYVATDIATCNGVTTRISSAKRLQESVVAFGDFTTASKHADRLQSQLSAVRKLAKSVARIRMVGSAATDLAWLASGRFDAVVMFSNKPWDTAAGVHLARTSGATATHMDGSEWTTTGPDLLCATPPLHEPLLEILAQHHDA